MPDQLALTLNGDPTPVPLPPSLVVQLTGLGLLGLLAWRKKWKGAAAVAA